MFPTLLAIAALWFAALGFVVVRRLAVRTKARLEELAQGQKEIEREIYLRAHTADLRCDLLESSISRLEMGQRLDRLTDLVALGDHEGRFPAPVGERLWRYAHELREEWQDGDGAAEP